MNRNVCNWILIIFELFGDSFSMLSAGFPYTEAVIVYYIVLIDD